MQRFFVTGTDTDVGKTVITTGLMAAFQAQNKRIAGHKPISAGCDFVAGEGLRNDDAMAMQAVTNVALPYALVNPVAFAEPIAPHIAAELASQTITQTMLDEGLAALSAEELDVLLVEGAGGWALPIGNDALLSDWVAKHQLPVIIVVGMRLGCLNHALLTYQAVQASGCKVVGWVANDFCDQPFADENIATLQAMFAAPLLGRVGKVDTRLTVAEQAQAVAAQLDVRGL
jgi:dethiobiotin synthetase